MRKAKLNRRCAERGQNSAGEFVEDKKGRDQQKK